MSRKTRKTSASLAEALKCRRWGVRAAGAAQTRPLESPQTVARGARQLQRQVRCQLTNDYHPVGYRKSFLTAVHGEDVTPVPSMRKTPRIAPSGCATV